jgi:hypothetical protein
MNSAWEVGVKLYECTFVQIMTMNTSDEDRPGPNRGEAGFPGKVLLADSNEMVHFVFDEVPNPG